MRRYDWTGAALIALPYVVLLILIAAIVVVAAFTVPAPGELR